MEKDFWDRFLTLEKENHFFDLQDKYGTYYWDILRYEVCPKLLWKIASSSLKNRSFKYITTRIFSTLYEPFRLFFFSPKKENLFYLSSRNKVNGKLIDQNAKSVYDLFPEQNNLVIETFDNHNYLKNSYFLPQSLFRRLFKKGKNTDFSFLMKILESEFGRLPFNEAFLQEKLSNYYADIYFFSNLFRKKKIKRVFLTQNGIQKGLMRAAKNLNIPVFEFQHGIVDFGHLAYNYSKMDYKEGQVTLSDTIFSFSPFWFKELYLPNVKIVPIGNDYFYNPLAQIIDDIDNYVAKGILIISSNVFGKELSDFILKIDKKYLENIPIYFKLHPNQFFEKEYYTKKLSSIKNIKIITNEQSVGELLKICSTMLAIQSTAIYEALQANRKVILLKKNSYLRHKHVFDKKNLHLVDTVDDFISALTTEIVIDPSAVFFTPFNKDTFLKVL